MSVFLPIPKIASDQLSHCSGAQHFSFIMAVLSNCCAESLTCRASPMSFYCSTF